MACIKPFFTANVTVAILGTIGQLTGISDGVEQHSIGNAVFHVNMTNFMDQKLSVFQGMQMNLTDDLTGVMRLPATGAVARGSISFIEPGDGSITGDFDFQVPGLQPKVQGWYSSYANIAAGSQMKVWYDGFASAPPEGFVQNVEVTEEVWW